MSEQARRVLAADTYVRLHNLAMDTLERIAILSKDVCKRAKEIGFPQDPESLHHRLILSFIHIMLENHVTICAELAKRGEQYGQETSG